MPRWEKEMLASRLGPSPSGRGVGARVRLLALVQIADLHVSLFLMHHALPAPPRAHVPSSGAARHLLPHEGDNVPAGEESLMYVFLRLRPFVPRCCGALVG